MTPAQVMAAKSDPGLGAKAITWLAQRNAGVLGNSNVGADRLASRSASRTMSGPGPAAKMHGRTGCNAPVSRLRPARRR